MVNVFLLAANDTSFTDRSRPLADAVSCTVRRDAQARDELSLTYPAAGPHLSALTCGAIILAKPDPYTQPQPYRIDCVKKSVSGLLSVSARHLAYDTLGIPVEPFSASGASACATAMMQKVLTACPFSLTTDVTKAGKMETFVPKSLRELTATGRDSWMSTFGGVLVFDRFTISLLADPGEDRGVVIRYGKDLVDFRQEDKISNMATGIIPYWTGSRSVQVGAETVSERYSVWGSVCPASGTYAVQRIEAVDMTEWFEAEPTVPQLNSYGAMYVESRGVGIPEVSLQLSYAELGQDVRLHDTVTVEFSLMGVSTQAKVTGVTYDCLRGVYTQLEVGAVRPTITDSLSDAGRLTNGTLPPERIADHSIGSSALGPGSVSEAALQALAVTRSKLAALAVGAGQLADGAVETNKIAPLAITTGKINDKAVNYAKSEYQGTLDQVETNKNDITTIKGYFTGRANFSYLQAQDIAIGNNMLFCDTITIGGVTYQVVKWYPT